MTAIEPAGGSAGGRRPRGAVGHARGDGSPGLRPRRGTRAHREYAAARGRNAAEPLTLVGALDVGTVELVNGEDVYGHLVRGGAQLTGAGPGRLPHFERQPGEVPAGDGWRIVDPALSHSPYTTLAGSIDACGLSTHMRESAHALDRVQALHTVAIAETAIASIAVSDDPNAIDDVLCSHGYYSAREQVARVLPNDVVQAAVVDGDLTRNQAIRVVCEAVVAYVGLSHCLRARLEGRLSGAKLDVVLRHSRVLRLHDVRWLDRRVARLNLDMPVETFAREVGRMAESCAPPAPRAKSVMDARGVSYERIGCGAGRVVLEGPITVLDPYMSRVDATAGAFHAANLSGLIVTGSNGNSVDAARVRVTDTRTLDQIRFDLIALSAPGGRVWGESGGDEPADPGQGENPADPGQGENLTAGEPDVDGVQRVDPPVVVERRWLSRPGPGRGEKMECDAVVDIPLKGPGARPGTIIAGATRTAPHVATREPWRNPLKAPEREPAGSTLYADDRIRRVEAPPDPTADASPADRTTCAAPPDRSAGASPPGQRPSEAPIRRGEVSEEGELEYFTAVCPTEGEWLAAQARVSVTVPVLTFIDPDSDLPADLAGVVPVPAETARRIVSAQSIVYRLLTDPASGEVLPEVATTYRVPAGMRRTVEERSKRCMIPGCVRRAARAQMDHIEPFNHVSPADGGLTVVTNLHPLCVFHHQEKTAGIIAVDVDDEGVETWSFPLGRHAIAVHEPNFTDARAAERLLQTLTEPPIRASGQCDASTGMPTAATAPTAPTAPTTTRSAEEGGRVVSDPDEPPEGRRPDGDQLGFDDGVPPF